MECFRVIGGREVVFTEGRSWRRRCGREVRALAGLYAEVSGGVAGEVVHIARALFKVRIYVRF
jgi:hypothetical protein